MYYNNDGEKRVENDIELVQAMDGAEAKLLLPRLPAASERRIALRISPAAERALRAGHPWLYDQAIREQSHDGKPGDLAVIFDRKRRFLAVGLYDPLSPIRVRVLQHKEPAPINADWFAQKAAAAIARRGPLQSEATTGYRVIHGENDGLPGLVLDRYGETYVVKLYAAAWIPHLETVANAILAQLSPGRLVLRLSRATQAHPAHLYNLHDGQVLLGRPLKGPVPFRENGLRFEADVQAGQKTGFFFDQRDNRSRVEALAEGKRVLNVFAYSGAFSLYAARGGAPLVVSQDISQPALAAAARNFQLNGDVPGVAAASHELLVGDAFQVLQSLQKRRPFDLVIIDPPSFAKSQDEVERALGAYRKLVRRGLKVLRPGGTLVICSCTARIGAEQFFEMVHTTAAGSGRPLQEFARSGHPPDHPVTFPEGAYLKCLFVTA